MDKKYLNILEVPEVDFNSTDRLVVIDVSNNIKVLGKESLNVDLSDYYTKEATNELLNNKADKITVTELAAKLKGDTDKLNKDITDLGNRVDSIPVITVDTEMNSESTNPVQNKAITNTITNLSNSVDEKLSNKQPKGDYALKSDLTPLATKSEVAEDVAQLNASLNEKQPKGDYALKTEIPTKVSQLSNDSNYQTAEDVNLATAGLATKAEVNSKQDTLVSGTNIKTINGNSLLGSGNIEIQGGSTIAVDDSLSTTSTNPVQNKIITEALNGKASQSDIPTKVSELTNDSDFQTASQVAESISGINVPTKVSQLDNDSDFQTGTQVSNSIATATSGLATKTELAGKQDRGDYATTAQLNGKQDTLVSGTNIKTINGNSILGAGNIVIEGGGGGLPSFGMSLYGTTITMTEGTIANFFNAIKAGKGNYRAYITKGNWLFTNNGQALTSGDEYFVRFDSVTPIKDKGKENSYYAANESLVIKVNNTSVTLLTGTNWTFDSNVVIVNVSGDNPTYYYGNYNYINSGTKIYLCATVENSQDLIENFRAEVTSFSGTYYGTITVNALVNGYILRYELNKDNTIESALINGEYKLDCKTWNITGASGQVGITETQYEQLMSNIKSNIGNIRIINSSCGDGMLINKYSVSDPGWDILKLDFLTVTYKTFSWGDIDGTPQQALFIVEIRKTTSTGVPPFNINWTSKAF